MEDIIVRNPMFDKRLFFLKTFVKPQQRICPECGHDLTEEYDEIICPRCGLVCSASIEYVSGVKINLPLGRRI